MLAPASIRLAVEEDVAALVVLNAEVHALHVASRPDRFKPGEPGEVEAWLRQHLASPAARVWLAEIDGTLVGYAVVMMRERAHGPFCPERVWWELDQVGVCASHRRRGVGRALVGRVLEQARLAQVTDVELTSWSFNRDARAAFRRLGFVPQLVRYEWRAR